MCEREYSNQSRRTIKVKVSEKHFIKFIQNLFFIDIKDLMMQSKFKLSNSSSNADGSEEEPTIQQRIRTPSFENKIEAAERQPSSEQKNIQ